MKFLDNLKMGPKLIGTFTLTAAFTIVVGLFAMAKLQGMGEADALLYQKGTAPLADWQDISMSTYRIRANMRDLVLGRNFAEYEKRIRDRQAERVKAEESFGATLATDAGRALWKRCQEVQKEIGLRNDRVIELMRAGKRADAEALLYGDLEKLQQDQNKIFDEMQNLKVDFAGKLSAQNTEEAKSATRAMFFMMVTAFGLAIAFGIIIARAISNPMKQGVEMMSELAKGHLGLRLKMDRHDEIGDLARAMDEFAEDLQVNAVGTLKKIAAGDLSTDVKPKDAQDEIMPALQQATLALRGMSAEAQRLAQAAVAG